MFFGFGYVTTMNEYTQCVFIKSEFFNVAIATAAIISWQRQEIFIYFQQMLLSVASLLRPHIRCLGSHLHPENISLCFNHGCCTCRNSIMPSLFLALQAIPSLSFGVTLSQSFYGQIALVPG